MITSSRSPAVVPRMNINGTPGQRLIDQQQVAVRAVRAAIDAVIAAEPNGRDYPSHEFRDAQREHVARLQALESVRDELTTIWHDLVEQDDARAAKRPR